MLITILLLYIDINSLMLKSRWRTLPQLNLRLKYRLLQDVYALDSSSRLEQILTGVTPVYGQYLKRDPTKKVVST